MRSGIILLYSESTREAAQDSAVLCFICTCSEGDCCIADLQDVSPTQDYWFSSATLHLRDGFRMGIDNIGHLLAGDGLEIIGDERD